MLQDFWKRIPWQVILLLFTIPFLLRNLLLPMFADDYAYAFIWDGDNLGNLMDNIGPRERIDNLSDIFISQWSHYFTWGGRTPATFLAQLFAWVGKAWFNIANTIVFMLLMLVLYWMAVGEVQSPARQKGVFLWVMLCMLFGVMDYPSTMLWMTGACNYHWTGLWACLFLLPFVTRRHPSAVVMAGAGLLAGWSEEGCSLVTVFIASCLIYNAWHRKRVERWMVVGFVFLIAGCGLLMFSPGSVNRELLDLKYNAPYCLPAEKLYTWEMFRDNFIEGFLPIIIWESFLFIPVLLSWRAKHHLDKHILLFTSAGLMVLCAMMFAPEFALRTGFHSTLFLTVASGAAFKESAPWLKSWIRATSFRRIVAKAGAAVAVVYGLLVMAGCFWVEVSLRQQADERLAYIEQHRDEPLIVVKAFHIPRDIDCWLGTRSITDFHLIYGADLEYEPTDNRSLMFAQYHGLKAIRTDRKVDWKIKNRESLYNKK